MENLVGEFAMSKVIIEHLAKKNGEKYNLHKCSEECQELGLVLNQYLLKPTKVDKQEVIDEVGDVLIRISILLEMGFVDPQKIQERINFKLSKYKDYLDHEKYNQI